MVEFPDKFNSNSGQKRQRRRSLSNGPSPIRSKTMDDVTSKHAGLTHIFICDYYYSIIWRTVVNT